MLFENEMGQEEVVLRFQDKDWESEVWESEVWYQLEGWG